MSDVTHVLADEAEQDEMIIRAKWILDGATTLAEAAEQARGFAAYLLGLKTLGYELRGPVEDDYGFCVKS